MKVRYCMFLIPLLASSALAQNATSSSPAQKPTANEVIEQIKAQVGVPWQAKTVDTFKAGDPQTPVTGIAVTMMATLDVLQRAAANGQTLIRTQEPTFFDHTHNPTHLP